MLCCWNDCVATVPDIAVSPHGRCCGMYVAVSVAGIDIGMPGLTQTPMPYIKRSLYGQNKHSARVCRRVPVCLWQYAFVCVWLCVCVLKFVLMCTRACMREKGCACVQCVYVAFCMRRCMCVCMCVCACVCGCERACGRACVSV